MISKSIRWRLQTWHGLILVAVLAAFGLSAYQVAWENQLRRIDQELAQRWGSIFRPPQPNAGPDEGKRDRRPPPDEHRGRDRRPEPDRRGPADFRNWIRANVENAGINDPNQTNTFYYVFWMEDGSLAAASPNAPSNVSMPALTATGGPGPFDPRRNPFQPPRTRDGRRELFNFFPGKECLLVGHDLTAERAAMGQLAVWLLMAGAGILLVGLAGGWWLASRAIRPIDEISSTATKIAAGDLTQRINAADTESELGRLAAVLNSTFARLEAAFAHQARFTSDASHELRTPISVIISQTQNALARDRGSEEYREALRACQRAAQRMRVLTESLLELAKLDAGETALNRQAFDLAKVARDCVELVSPLAGERGIKVSCNLTSSQCFGDPDRIAQVATNLLTNAIHFNRDSGQVKVSTSAQNGTVILTVADTGEGIPPEDLPHIFERFYRVDKSRSRRQGCNGLGLAISKAIVDAHGGTIEVSSQPGVGSSFALKLPVK